MLVQTIHNLKNNHFSTDVSGILHQITFKFYILKPYLLNLASGYWGAFKHVPSSGINLWMRNRHLLFNMISPWYLWESIGHLPQYFLYLHENTSDVTIWWHDKIWHMVSFILYVYLNLRSNNTLGLRHCHSLLCFLLEHLGKLPTIYHVVLWSFCWGLSTCFRLGKSVDTMRPNLSR